MQLVEEAVDGGWIGHRARMSAQNSEIGSVYSPPSAAEQKAKDKANEASEDHVETVIDVGFREQVCALMAKVNWSLNLCRDGSSNVKGAASAAC